MISLILVKKILTLFLMLAMGFLLVRLRVMKAEDSRVLSMICLYLTMPCLNLAAFQVEYSSDVRNGLILAFAAAILAELVMILAARALNRVCPLDPVETTSSIYSNSGNMVIPIVQSMLGPQYVIYTTAYNSVQMFLFWSHCKMTLCGERKIDLKKIFGNINMVAILLGLGLFLARVQLPEVLLDAVRSTGDMVGPLSMMITGMLIGGMELKKVFVYRRVWLVAALRLLAFPALALVLLKLSPLAGLVPDGYTILMLTLLAASAPAAASVTQMAQVYDRDADYASACNVVTTLLSVFTMPVMIFLYQL